jgi:hypothetical protein
MTDQFSHYSFSSASQTSSSRKRPRRLRVKNYVDGVEHDGREFTISGSRIIDMTGEITDGSNSAMIRGSSYHNQSIFSQDLESLSRQSSISTQNSTINYNSQHHPESLLQQPLAKSNVLGRIRHSLAAEEATTTQVSLKDEDGGNTVSTYPPADAAPPRKLLEEQSSSDGDEVFSQHQRLGAAVDGAFPSNNTTIQEQVSQESITSSEIQSSINNNTSATSISSHSQRFAIAASLSNLSDHSSECGGVEASVASSAATESVKNSSWTCTSSKSNGQFPDHCGTTTDCDEAWKQVVQAQTNDVNPFQDDDSDDKEANSSSIVPPSPIRPFAASSMSSNTSTSRYEAYRASVGRNFNRDEKPWPVIAQTAASTIQVPPPPPLQLTTLQACTSIEVPLEEIENSDQHNDNDENDGDMDESTVDDREEVYSQQSKEGRKDLIYATIAGAATPVFSPSGNSVYEDSTRDADHPSIFQDTSLDQPMSPPQRRDDDGGFPYTASMLHFAMANTPPSSPGVSGEIYNDDDDEGDSYNNGGKESSSGEEYEIEILNDDDDDIQQREGPNWRFAEEEEDQNEALTGVVVAANILPKENLATASPSKTFRHSYQKEESLSMGELRSIEDVDAGGNEQSRAKSVDQLNYVPSSRRSKRFQLWKERGVYIRSSASLSVSSHSSVVTEPPPVVSRARESLYDRNANSSWKKSIGALFRWRDHPEPKQTMEPNRLESPPVCAGVDDEEFGVSGNIPLQMPDEEEDEKKKMAQTLALAAVLFKKDDLHRVEKTEKVKSQVDPKDPRAFQASVAAAAASLAMKRQQRLKENGINEGCENEEMDVEVDMIPRSLSAQVAMLARKKQSLRSAEDYDNLYKKEAPKKVEPKLMVQLRSVKKNPSTEEIKTKEVDEAVPTLMVQLRPVGSRPDNSPDRSMNSRVPELENIPTDSIPSQDEKTKVTRNDVESHRPNVGRSGHLGKDLEAYQAFSETSSVVSSKNIIEPVFEEEQTSLWTGALRNCFRLIIVLVVLAAIALPLYFLVFADARDPSPNDGTGGIYPTTASQSPSFAPSPPSTTITLPSQSPVMPTSGSLLRPSMSDSPTSILATTESTSSPTVDPIQSTQSANPSPTINPSEDLKNLLVSVWPSLDDVLTDPDGTSSPQVLAFEWMKADPTLSSYSDAQKIQRFTMATFFYSTGGDNWAQNDGWVTLENECLWYSSSFRGSCDDSGNLLYLELNDNALSGTLPSELALLSNSLIRLLLTGNSLNETDQMPRLSGSLPSELGQLTLLEVMSLNNNDISGSLPSQMGQLSLLSVLDLERNELNGSLPTTIGNLRQLNNLYMAFNRLSGALPSELGYLSMLVNLDFYGNQLSSSLPTELGHLSILQSISLGDNKLEGAIPTHLGELSNLQGSVNLAGNLLTGTIPTELGQLLNIRNNLNLSNNKLTGSLPFELGKMVNLRGLELQNNKLTGLVPTGFSSLGKLEVLRLEFNAFTGVVPVVVCQSLVTDQVFNNPTLFVTDCMGEIECSCCQYCCADDVGCECQFANTDNDFLCINPALEASQFTPNP